MGEDFPPDVLGKPLNLALPFKKLATLRTDAALFQKVERLFAAAKMRA